MVVVVNFYFLEPLFFLESLYEQNHAIRGCFLDGYLCHLWNGEILRRMLCGWLTMVIRNIVSKVQGGVVLCVGVFVAEAVWVYFSLILQNVIPTSTRFVSVDMAHQERNNCMGMKEYTHIIYIMIDY